jgi:hypothetical protein
MDDCTSVGFSGQGRCLEDATVSRTTESGQVRVCFEHFVAERFTPFREG